MTVGAFPPIEDLLPHRGTMLLLDRVVSYGALTLRAEYTVRGDAWYADRHGAMPAWIGIELMAQAIGAHVGLSALKAGSAPRPGVLLGTRCYQAQRDSFGAGTRLVVEVAELLRSAAGHGAYECGIDAIDAAEHCAEAVIKVFQPNDFQTFIARNLSS